MGSALSLGLRPTMCLRCIKKLVKSATGDYTDAIKMGDEIVPNILVCAKF